MRWNNPRWGRDGPWGGQNPWNGLRWGAPEYGPGTPPEPPWDDGAAFSWQLTENREPGEGDMAGFGMTRVSDRTEVGSDLELNVRRYGPGTQLWWPSDPSGEGDGITNIGEAIITPYSWPYSPPSGTLLNSTYIPEGGVSANSGIRKYLETAGAIGETVRFSFYIILHDGSEPVVSDSPTDPAADFCVILENGRGANWLVESMGNGVYRITSWKVAVTGNTGTGWYKYVGNSTKGVRGSGYFYEILG